MLPPLPPKNTGSSLPPLPPKKKDGTDVSSIQLEGGESEIPSTEGTAFSGVVTKPSSVVGAMPTTTSFGTIPQQQEVAIKQERVKTDYLTNTALKYLSTIPNLDAISPAKLKQIKEQAVGLGIPADKVDEVYTIAVEQQRKDKGLTKLSEKRSEITERIKKGTGDYDILPDPGAPMVKTSGIAPQKPTPEMVDKELTNYATNIVINEFPDKKELLDINKEIERIENDINSTQEDYNRRLDLIGQRQELGGGKRLFNPISGNFEDAPNAETEKYAQEVEAIAEGLRRTPREKLGEKFFIETALFDDAQKQYLTPREYSPEEMSKLGLGNFQEPRMLSLKNIYGIYSTRGIIDTRMNKSKQEEELYAQANAAHNSFIASRKNMDALTDAYLLNIDPGKGDLGLMDYAATGFLEGLENSNIIGPIAKSIFGEPGMTDVQRLETYANLASDAGIGLTDTQKKEVENTIGETVFRAGGGSVPVMGDIILSTVLLNGIGGTAALDAGIANIAANATKNYGNIAGAAAKIVGEGVKSAITFEIAGAGGTTGLGEGAAQGLLDRTSILSRITGKFATPLKIAVKTGAGALGETFGEYSGEFANALADNGFDYDKVMDQTFGKDLDEAVKKGVATLVVSLAFSGAANTATLVAGKEWLQAQDVPNKEELIKQIDEKIASEPSVNIEQLPVSEPPKPEILVRAEDNLGKQAPEDAAPQGKEKEALTSAVEPTKEVVPVVEPIAATTVEWDMNTGERTIVQPTGTSAPVTETVVEEIKPIKVGKFEYKKTEEGYELINEETGNVADPKSVRKYKDKVIELATPLWAKAKTVERQENDEAYVNDVANNSDSPFQISEAYMMSEKIPFDLNYKNEKIADILDGAVIDVESFATFSDRNLMGDMKGYSFGKNTGTVGQIDILAKEASSTSGMDISPQDIVNFMRENKSVKEFREASKNPYSRSLQQKFKKLTGLPLNAETALSVQVKQVELMGVKEAELESLYNQSQSEDYETTKREFEQYLESNPEAAERFFGPQAEVDVAVDTSDGGEQENISESTVAELGVSFADTIRRAKIDTKGIVGSFIIPPQLWNGAVEAVALSFEGGAKIVNAIKEGAKYLREQLAKQGIAQAEIKNYEAEFMQRANFMTRKPKKTDTDEMASIKKELRDRLKAFKRGFKKGNAAGVNNIKEDRKRFQDGIKEAIKPLKSRISPVQERALVNRAAKVSTERQLELFEEYAEKVISDANYADNLETVRKAIKQLKRKLKGRWSVKIKEIAKLGLSKLSPIELVELKRVADAASLKVPDVSLLEAYIVPEQEADVSKMTPEKYEEAKKKVFASRPTTIQEYRNTNTAINKLRKALNYMLADNELSRSEYDEEAYQLDQLQESFDILLEEESNMLKQDELPNIRENLNGRDAGNFTVPENEFLLELSNLSDSEIMALPLSDVEALSEISDRVRDGFLPLRQATDIYNKAKGKSQGMQIAGQINTAIETNRIPSDLEKAKIKLAQSEIQKVEDMLGIGRGSAVFKYLYNPIAKALGKAKVSDVNLWKQYLNVANTGFSTTISKITSLPIIGNVVDKISGAQRKRDVSKAKVVMKRYAEMTKAIEGYSSGMEIASMDWFGLLLGEQAAFDAIRFSEDVINKEERIARLKREMKSQAGRYNSKGQGKTNGRSQLEIMAEIYKTIPRNADGTANWDKAPLTAKEQAIYNTVAEIIDKQKDKLMFSNEAKGLPWEELPSYLPTLRLSGPDADLENKPGKLKTKIRSGSSYERTDFKPGAINIDLDAIMKRIITDTNQDYYLGTALNTVSRSRSYAAGILQNDMGRDNTIVSDVINSDIERRIDFNKESGDSYPLVRNLTNAMYIAKLGDPVMRLIDTISSFLKIPFYTGSAKSLYYGFAKGKRDMYAKLIKDTGSSLDIKVSKVTDPSVTGSLPDQTPVGKATQMLLGFDDWFNPVALWLPNFESEFLEITGDTFDAKAYMEDPGYYEQNKTAIDDAASFADRETKRLYGPSTKFEQRRLVKVLPFLDGLQADKFWGKMASILGTFAYREQGEFISNIQALWTAGNKGRSVGAMRGFANLMSATAFGMLATTWYLTKQTLMGDDEEKKKAQKALDELLSTEGALKETASTLGFLGMSRYGQVGRYNTLLALSFVHEFTNDKEQKAQVKNFIKSNLFTNPIEFTPKGFGYSALNSAVPPLAHSFATLTKVVNGGTGWRQEPDGLVSLIKKYEKEGFDGLTRDEQDRWALFSNGMQMLSFVAAFGGYSLPGKSTIEKAVRDQIKEEKIVTEPKKRLRVL